MEEKKLRNSDERRESVLKYGFGAVLLILGVIFNMLDIGRNYFFGYKSVGTYLIFCGMLIFAIRIFRSFKKNKKSPDERMILVALKASRLTFVFVALVAAVVMIIDGIKSIDMPYSLFMGYFVCLISLFYFVSYKVLLKYN